MTPAQRVAEIEAEIVPFEDDPVQRSADGVVEALERTLDEARAGLLVAVGIVVVKRGDVIGTEFVHEDARWALHSGAALLAHRVLTYDDGNGEEEA